MEAAAPFDESHWCWLDDLLIIIKIMMIFYEKIFFDDFFLKMLIKY